MFVAAEPIEEAAFLVISRYLRDRDAIEALIQARIDRVVALTGSAGEGVDELARRVRDTEVRIGEETAEMRSAGLPPAAIAAAIKPLADELEAVTKMHAAALRSAVELRPRRTLRSLHGSSTTMALDACVPGAETGDVRPPRRPREIQPLV